MDDYDDEKVISIPNRSKLCRACSSRPSKPQYIFCDRACFEKYGKVVLWREENVKSKSKQSNELDRNSKPQKVLRILPKKLPDEKPSKGPLSKMRFRPI